jgi:hypothetical protein
MLLSQYPDRLICVAYLDPWSSELSDKFERRKFVLALDLGAVASRSYQTDAVRIIASIPTYVLLLLI